MEIKNLILLANSSAQYDVIRQELESLNIFFTSPTSVLIILQFVAIASFINWGEPSLNDVSKAISTALRRLETLSLLRFFNSNNLIGNFLKFKISIASFASL